MSAIRRNTIKLRLTVGQEHELLPLQKIDERNTLMYPAYQEAARALCGIIKSAKRFNSIYSCPKQKDLYSYANNTIAFCGSRGQGKTSTMLSFGNALKDKDMDGSAIQHELDPDGMIADSRFHVMDPIDPTMLKKGGHIAEIVLSYLYGQMRKMFDDGKGEGLSTKDRERELRRFQQSIGWLCQSSDGIDRSDDFYDFEKPGHGFDIKENLYHIIKSFLQLKYNSRACSRTPQGREDLFLVIMLDDMDLQLENSYDILEEVRQYLQLPNTIVLMATDIVQLRRTIAMHYCSQMNTAIEHKLMNQDDVRRLAAKYLDKLIPAAQTIYLPEYKLSICRGDDIIVEFADKEFNKHDNANGSEKFEELHACFSELIFRKTGLVFVRHQSYVNNLFPTTLRGLRQMYRLFDSMPEPCKPTSLPASFWEESNLEDSALRDRKIEEANRRMYDYLEARLSRVHQLESNLAVFKDYFLGDWSASKLDSAGEKTLDRISRSAIPASFSTAQRELDIWLKVTGLDSFVKDHPHAIGESYSELCVRLDDITKIGNEQAYLLAFAVHTYFSIQFTEETLREQHNQLEGECDAYRTEPSYKQRDICRFSLCYPGLRERYKTRLFGPELYTRFLGEEERKIFDPSLIFQIYLEYLRRRNSTLDKRSLIKAWRYWDGQDWAVQFCCNWELQEYALKFLKELTGNQSEDENINELNTALLEKAPVCNVSREDWQQIITKEYSSPFRKVPAVTETGEDSLLQEQQHDAIQSALGMVDQALSLIGQYVGVTSIDAEIAMRAVWGKLQDVAVVLAPYINSSLKKELDDICARINTELPVSSDTYHQLKLLRSRISKFVKRNSAAGPSTQN